MKIFATPARLPTPAFSSPTHKKIRIHGYFYRCLYCTKLEPIFKIADTAFPARYAPLCEAQSFPKWKVRENAIQSGRDFAKAIFWGKDFAKSRLILFEIRRGFLIWFPRAGEVWGGMRAELFWAGAMEKKDGKC